MSHGALSGSVAFSISSFLLMSTDMTIRLLHLFSWRVPWGAGRGGAFSNDRSRERFGPDSLGVVSIALPHTACRAATKRLPTRPCFF